MNPDIIQFFIDYPISLIAVAFGLWAMPSPWEKIKGFLGRLAKPSEGGGEQPSEDGKAITLKDVEELLEKKLGEREIAPPGDPADNELEIVSGIKRRRRLVRDGILEELANGTPKGKVLENVRKRFEGRYQGAELALIIRILQILGPILLQWLFKDDGGDEE